jgi:LemA protein
MTNSQKTLLVVAVVIIVIILIPFFYLKGTYNSLVTMDEGVKAAWAQVENQLQRRYDLIPNLVETVKGYAAHEKEVFLKVTEARAKVAGADLKANVNFIRLQDELAGTENRISVERRRYNESVREYNVAIRRFPTNLLAGLFGFDKAAFFEVPEERQEAPKVKF